MAKRSSVKIDQLSDLIQFHILGRLYTLENYPKMETKITEIVIYMLPYFQRNHRLIDVFTDLQIKTLLSIFVNENLVCYLIWKPTVQFGVVSHGELKWTALQLPRTSLPVAPAVLLSLQTHFQCNPPQPKSSWFDLCRQFSHLHVTQSEI